MGLVEHFQLKLFLSVQIRNVSGSVSRSEGVAGRHPSPALPRPSDISET